MSPNQERLLLTVARVLRAHLKDLPAPRSWEVEGDLCSLKEALAPFDPPPNPTFVDGRPIVSADLCSSGRWAIEADQDCPHCGARPDSNCLGVSGAAIHPDQVLQEEKVRGVVNAALERAAQSSGERR